MLLAAVAAAVALHVPYVDVPTSSTCKGEEKKQLSQSLSQISRNKVLVLLEFEF